ncbi:MAG: response regulator transcription factor [Pseudomonadota bacterium]
MEDDPEVTHRIERVLERSASYCLAVCFSNFIDAYHGWQRSHFDILLVDLGLPDGDGVDLIEEVAEHRPGARILVFSSHSDELGVLRSLQAGAHGYVLKDGPDDRLLESFDQLMDGGAPLTPSVAACVLKHLKRPLSQERHAATDRESPLTIRETEVLTHIARGMSNAEIGDYLNVTINTVRAHTKNIFRKLSVHSRAAAIYRALDDGIIQM